MRSFTDLYQSIFNVVAFILLVFSEVSTSQHCSRSGSRLVRQVLNKNFYPVFESHGANLSVECPLRKSRDLYYFQEMHKTFEHNARWSCGICGKAFYKQEYIDLHMGKKHGDLLVKGKDSPVCLADYCQLFRCEALERKRRKKYFWSKALCNKENMKKLKKKCLILVQSCIPDTTTSKVYKQVYDEIIEETCSLINCKDYWQPLHYELSSLEILYYITFTPIFISALSIYYYNVWEHYYGDESEKIHNEKYGRKLSNDKEKLAGVRNRFTSSRFEY